MATATGKARCFTCGKEKSTVRCDGCSQPFCYNHLGDHRQELNKQLDEIEVTRDLFRQTLIEQTTEPQKHPLIRQIDEWERDSINKIRQTAEETRQLLLKHTAGHITEIEIKLNKLTNQLRESRQENDFFETDLQQWKDQLMQLTKQLTKPSAITVRHSLTPLVTKLSVDVSDSSYMPNIGANAKWIQNGITVAGGNGRGSEVNQLSNPYGLYVDDDQTIYVADFGNQRIVEWKNGATSGQVVAGRNDQLNGPTDVIVDKENDSLIICDYSNQQVLRWSRRNGTSAEIIISGINCYGLTKDNNGCLYVSDYSKHEVTRWKKGDTSGTVVAGGNGHGNRLDQLCGPTCIFVDREYSVYVSDGNNHRVMKWMEGAEEGVVVAGGQGQGNSLTQLHNPRGVVVDQLGTVYVVDHSNHRVMCWPKEATQGSVVVGGNGQGGGANQLYSPWGLSFDRQGHLYIVDYYNRRVQKFHIDPSSSS